MPLALGKDHVVWEADGPLVKWQQPLSMADGVSGMEASSRTFPAMLY